MYHRKYQSSKKASSFSMVPLNQLDVSERVNMMDSNMSSSAEPDVDIDLREVYFLIMHFLSMGPCNRTSGQFWNELLQHRLLPRRYHAWYSRNGTVSGNENDDGMSLPLSYANLVERYAHIEKDHLVKLLKQLIQSCSPRLNGVTGGRFPIADVSTILGSGSFSLLASNRNKEEKMTNPLPGYLRWPHMHADQVRGLRLRELGGGFTKHHRAPSTRAACYAIAKPSTLAQKMQFFKTTRGHQNAVYCATFDRTGRYVITGSDDRLVKVWSIETAFCLASCRGHEGDITDLAVSYNNTLVASSSNDFIIRVWRLPDGLPISVLKGHSGTVTAIAFSPRSVYQLLSSSDDGTCRIWDARYSDLSPQIYIPKLPDALPGKSSQPSTSVAQPSHQTHQILCCAFNANGTVFVTGSSDKNARVWNACKSNFEDLGHPIHEMDILSGHEDDVNYVQFSGCTVASRVSIADAFKEDNIPKFKNSWFTHDNIVTCSRDGSAIIWIPRSRRSQEKVGRWTRAYHLQVPPPPVPPQPPRGGPRHRYQPSPRGVNMIVWSLDNRFVLAAIMDCRICVWNASDGSLVHSLHGHVESTFVLDVHPFNPRIAMTAGYDGKTIIWDIWEGIPVRIYETGRFKLVDGKFSPDGTSIVLSDEVGQMHIIATGQGESQKNAKYDQFFLGDYRPLIQDTNGNVVDQETQLVPHHRNIQDILCDSRMIPYPDPFQSMYQKRRLGILGIEWRPSSISFSVGPAFSTNAGDFSMAPIIDLEQWVEPLPEFLDAIDWDPPENEIQSDDNDSEYNVTDEIVSEAENAIFSCSSSGDVEGSGGNSSTADQCHKDQPRRSRRKKRVLEDGYLTSSGRKVKRRNLDEHEAGPSVTENHKKHRLRHGKSTKTKILSEAKAGRPRRRTAKNALNLFSKMKALSSDEEDFDLEISSSESESAYSYTSDSEKSISSDKMTKSDLKDESEDAETPLQPLNLQSDHEKANSDSCEQEAEVETSPKDILAGIDLNRKLSSFESGKASGIKWGEVKKRSSKSVKLVNASNFTNARLKISENGVFQSPQNNFNIRDRYAKSGRKSDDELKSTDLEQCGNGIVIKKCQNNSVGKELENGRELLVDGNDASHSANRYQTHERNTPKLSIRANGLSTTENTISPAKFKSVIQEDSKSAGHEPKSFPEVPEKDGRTSGHCPGHSNTNNEKVQGKANDKRFMIVYKKRSKSLKSSKDKQLANDDACRVEGSTSDHANMDDTRRTRSMSTKMDTDEMPITDDGRGKERHGYSRASKNNVNSKMNGGERTLYDDLSPSASFGIRSTRVRRENYSGNRRAFDFRSKNKQIGKKLSWLLLTEHEESYRYIPQLGDEVAYLRQGHEGYTGNIHHSREAGPSGFNGLKAVELCKVQTLDYATLPGSGESCCELMLKFTDPSSTVFGETLKLTLPELVAYPDFLVERTRYDASIERNWVHRDKCFVWWRNEDGNGGSWWEGRILEVKPKSIDFSDSPWERLIITYKDDPGRHSHSPWELHDDKMGWQHPHIDEGTRDYMLSCIVKLEGASVKKDKYGIEKLNQVVQKSEFLNRRVSFNVLQTVYHGIFLRTEMVL